MYFWSDQMIYWPSTFVNPDSFWIRIDLTKRPFLHSKINMRSLLIISIFYKHIKVFIPTFFAVIEDEQTSFAINQALLKYKSEIFDHY